MYIANKLHTIDIHPNELHLWFIDTDKITSCETIDKYREIVSEEEQARMSQFQFEHSRFQYLITRAATRTILSYYCNSTEPRAWEFGKNRYGKPFVVNYPVDIPIQFNISHSNKLVVLAITREQDIGVDVEYSPKDDCPFDIAYKYFSTREVSEMNSLTVEEKIVRFYQLWTLKEAYIKAKGIGLSLPLNKFYFTFPRKDRIEISFETSLVDDAKNWFFWHIRPNPHYQVSVALHSGKRNMVNYKLIMRENIPLSHVYEISYPIEMKSWGMTER